MSDVVAAFDQEIAELGAKLAAVRRKRNEAVREANRQHRETRTQRNTAICQAYEAGHKIEAIAAAFGTSPGAIGKVARKAQLAFRRPWQSAAMKNFHMASSMIMDK